ncbi:MAG TPA: hypothetical protein VF519_00515 [Mycobacteriales bacterium]|jgi:hypothetical protein
MTGATPFTRTAGVAGVVGAATLAGLFPALVLFHGRLAPHGVLAAPFVLAIVTVVVCVLTWYAGLLYRHRAHLWIWPALVLLALGIVTAPMDGDTGRWLGRASAVVVAVGVLAAGELPRHGGVALVVGTVGDVLFRDTVLGIVAGVAGFAALVILARAMRRETPVEVREDRLPALPDGEAFPGGPMPYRG